MTRALLVIDVQESFRQGPLWPAISNPAIAGDVARLVDGVRARGDLVVWVLHSEPGSGTPFDPASGYVRYLDGLEPRPGEPQLTKTSHNAFRGPWSSGMCSTSSTAGSPPPPGSPAASTWPCT